METEIDAAETRVQAHETGSRVSAWQLLRTWLVISFQSFGGGVATQYLIYRAFVERRKLVSPEEFARAWGACQLAPGINLLALTTLIGWRLAGGAGVALSVAGLLLPSTVITLAMTALYAGVREAPAVQAALRGVVPATVGLGLLLSLQLARPLLRRRHRGGSAISLLGVGLIAGSAVVFAVTRPPVPLVLVAAAAIAGTAARWSEAERKEQS